MGKHRVLLVANEPHDLALLHAGPAGDKTTETGYGGGNLVVTISALAPETAGLRT